MKELKNIGSCNLCNEVFEHRFASRHVKKCLETNKNHELSDKEKIYLLKISDGKLFWIYLEMNGSLRLEDLDEYLRDLWLECCGHLSMFTIENEVYDCDDGSMRKKIHQIFKIGTKFSYEYDFGSTTLLKGDVISNRAGKLADGFRLIARNNLPALQCAKCSNDPVLICAICMDFLCNKCKKKHKTCEDGEAMLPVVNSPRMGVCGYGGSEY